MTDSRVVEAYQIAREIYAGIGIETESTLHVLSDAPVSLQCWQGDDVKGFEQASDTLTGGIVATGDYPGRARTPDELRQDLDFAMNLMPGRQKVNLHASYLDAGGGKVDRDAIEPCHYEGWVQWAKERKIGLDFNPTFFSHPNSADGFTLSHADPGIQSFWIEHAKRARKIGEYFGKTLGQTCVTNIWIPDGYKDSPADRLGPRLRLLSALDSVLSRKIDPAYNRDAVESKLFGIGSEAYVVGSHEFYMGYVLSQPEKNLLLTLDAGHFHPTETVSSKISALLPFARELLLHVSRPVRWDSDHVVVLDDELQAIMSEIVRCNAQSCVHLALDYFDASINRIAAWVIGIRSTQKALLKALLEPVDQLRVLEYQGDLTARLALTEEYKAYPWQAVWDYFCLTQEVPLREAWLHDVRQYEKTILSQRD